MIREISELIPTVRSLHENVREAVVSACERASLDDMSKVARDDEGDTIYAVDRVSEELLVSFFNAELARKTPLILIAEGLPGGKVVLPLGARESEAGWRIIVDPIDGTRGLMYQKRSAWILTGVAPNRGAATRLADIELAVQTEIPLVKQHLSDSLWAIRGRGWQGERLNRLSRTRTPLRISPSGARTILHGFAMLARFFPGAREELAAIDEEIVLGALGRAPRGKAQCFEDQYISSGGQLYELMAGHDRFVADLRPLMEKTLEGQGRAVGLCCHPYDICTELIAKEMGVVVTDPWGRALAAPLATEADVAWVGYANPAIRAQIEPLLQAALIRRGLRPEF